MERATGGDGPERPGRPDDGQRARLRAELLALREGLEVPEAAGATMAERVLAQIVAEGVPVPVREPLGRLERVRAWWRGHVRVWVAALSGVLVVLVLTPPVRAAVVEWFDFGGVEVRWVPGAPGGTPAEEAHGPGCGVPLPMPDAVRRAGFRPVVPDALGAPDSVAVTGLPEGRSMVTLCWKEGGRTIRLDAFAAGLDPYFTKQVRVPPEWVELHPGGAGAGLDGRAGGLEGAAWFAEPHRLEFMMVGEDGDRWIRTERTAGPTLLWMRDARMTFRLEGVDDVARAREIAESTL
ncbi:MULTISPECIES: hypothetical protein [Streptomyces]|uniref:DUF4367 domain-containing protein n=1 Tax=Streptomyces glycanivorans TaxID=3033808 RepID=A0ABY9JCC8_9ACTN|nr:MULTISPECIES: hypothetical protein [unclassified Streptomyces]WSQ77975.1 hypothetical protein OG725_13050 [Streptomyces sp. NBC_01213]WLQ64594.1 hypothetical protein P8A20_13770 [Streptomyces sp. Alt3]WSQ85348.1 hypothetical protein OG722_13720 [Streptomyces sp. NBC_01212]WSR08560.1 hypothetical protein OG265_22295 [Streptomyces sp. NBC_01208]WSR48691.1 hypothetical protein OG279_14100 [Streptomyces sp. NBC_01201]